MKKYYSVARGRNIGIFDTWFGPCGAEVQIRGFAGARFKGFAAIEEARQWLESMTNETHPLKKSNATGKCRKAESTIFSPEPVPMEGKVVIYTDGGCSYNPGPGGYGVVLFSGTIRQELSGGFRLTTNNRMEMTACIVGLRALKNPSAVTVCSDSKYIVDAVSKGWARKWRKNGWMRTTADAAENYDLWEQLLDLCDRHSVEFVWVKGHAGNPENECCDRLATGAAAGKNLLPDKAYEGGQTRVK